MIWEEESYTRTDENGNLVSLDEYKRRHSEVGRYTIMSRADIKLYLIAGVGFFLDSYDLFVVNLLSPIWLYEYWGGLQGKKPDFPSLLRGTVNASANIGNIFGQLIFGFLGDAFGRKFVYGKELILGIVGTILVISLPNSIPTPTLKMVWIICFRLLMGAGIGGDYPMSASIVAERSSLARRGQMLGWIFSNQGWGTLAASIATLIILSCFQPGLEIYQQYNQLDAVWRIQMGIALVPAFATLYFRLTMPEGKKFKESQELNFTPSSSVTSIEKIDHDTKNADDVGRAELGTPGVEPEGGAKWNVFLVYFSEWRHLKALLGTMSTWFLVDVAFYGTNLNQSVLLTEIGYSTGANEFETLKKNAIGNLIIAVAGYVPGYFLTIFFIEKLGRKWIQIQGFLVSGLMFAIIAGDYGHLTTAPKFVCFAIAQLFFNFGPNATTFIVPAEAFPSRVRGLSHGLSAAVGKLGAILSSLLFNYLSGPSVIGLANVLWIFFACMMLGAICTWFLVPETTGRDADAIDYEEWCEAHGRTDRVAAL